MFDTTLTVDIIFVGRMQRERVTSKNATTASKTAAALPVVLDPSLITAVIATNCSAFDHRVYAALSFPSITSSWIQP